MDSREILNIETKNLDKPLTGSNLKKNHIEKGNLNLDTLQYEEQQVVFWVFSPQLCFNKELLSKLIDNLKSNLQIKFFQQKAFHLNLNNAEVLLGNSIEKDDIKQFSLGETLVLMSNTFSFDFDKLFEPYRVQEKKKKNETQPDIKDLESIP